MQFLFKNKKKGNKMSENGNSKNPFLSKLKRIFKSNDEIKETSSQSIVPNNRNKNVGQKISKLFKDKLYNLNLKNNKIQYKNALKTQNIDAIKIQNKPALHILHFNDVYNIESNKGNGGVSKFMTMVDDLKGLNPLILFRYECVSIFEYIVIQ